MGSYCGEIINKSRDYLLDIASVTGQKTSLKDIDEICSLKFEPKILDSNYKRGNWMGIYVKQLIEMRFRKNLYFGLFIFLMLCISVGLFTFKFIKISKTSIIISILGFLLINFIYYLIYNAHIQKDPVSLSELYQRTTYGLTPREMIIINNLLPEEYSEGYSGIYLPPNFSFPLDHQMNHYTYPTEWYWYVATLKDKNNPSDLYSVEMLFLRQSVISPSVISSTLDQTLENTQIYESTIKISSTKDNKMFQGRNCTIPTTSGLVGLGYQPFNISIGKNILYSTDVDNNKFFPLKWNIQEPINSVNASLTFKSSKNIIFRGDRGLDPPTLKGLGIGTFYYSWPNIITEGTINILDREIQVEGVGWMDHQIFSGISPLGKIRPEFTRLLGNFNSLFKTDQVNAGWDFVIIQMEDSSTYFFTRGLEGVDSSSNNNIRMVGKYSSPKNEIKDIEGIGQIVRRIDKNGYKYPCEWKIKYDNLEFNVKSIVDDIFIQLVRGEFVEIGAIVTEKNKNMKGTGWIENVGYGPSNIENYKKYLQI